MDKKLAVVVIHGMGSQDKGEDGNEIHPFAKPMIDELYEKVGQHGKDPDQIAWKTIYWANILEGKEDDYFTKMKQRSEVDAKRARNFVIKYLGDATGYQKVESSANTAYDRIHERVRDSIKELYDDELDHTSPPPLVVIAHSLGGHIMSNYVYDRQKPDDNEFADLSDFERMRTLAGMVTFGCNIPLYLFAYDVIKPITFPAKELSNDIKEKSKWLNFYDPDDILGYPLKPIDEYKAMSKLEDRPINVGGLFTSWNPLSHMKYWTDNSLTKPVAKFISDFLE